MESHTPHKHFSARKEFKREIHHFLHEHGVVPHVWSSLIDPSYVLHVEFPSVSKSHTEQPVKEMEHFLPIPVYQPEQCVQKPHLFIFGSHLPAQYSFFTLVMVDSSPMEISTNSQVVHWVVGNMPCEQISKQFRLPINQGQEIVAYLAPKKQKGTGTHRFMLFLFEHGQHVEFDSTMQRITGYEHRDRFNLENFAGGFKLGKPVAVCLLDVEEKHASSQT